jgi:DNA invertase Pin-like site-specific DNA recombinase
MLVIAEHGRLVNDRNPGGRGVSLRSQKRALETVAKNHGWKVVGVFKDEGISGAKGRDKRPGLDALLKGVARRDFDLVAAWSVDRLGRSLKGLLDFIAELDAKGIDLYLDQQRVDTSTPAGEALFQMCGVFSQFERALIGSRVQAGLRKARAEGTNSGRPFGRPRVSAEVEAQIREQLALGLGIHRVAKVVGCGSGTVQRVRANA